LLHTAKDSEFPLWSLWGLPRSSEHQRFDQRVPPVSTSTGTGSAAVSTGPAAPRRSPVREFTLRAVVLGGIITLVFTAANVYLGLRVGLTFATSIPAAVISMAILRNFQDHTIQENNIVQTIASAAGTLSAIIFVLPGLCHLDPRCRALHGYSAQFPGARQPGTQHRATHRIGGRHTFGDHLRPPWPDHGRLVAGLPLLDHRRRGCHRRHPRRDLLHPA